MWETRNAYNILTEMSGIADNYNIKVHLKISCDVTSIHMLQNRA